MTTKTTSTKTAAAAAEAEAKNEPLSIEFAGVTYKLNRTELDDVELLELTADYIDGQYVKLPAILRHMLGEKQWSAFKDAHRTETGRVPTDPMDELFDAINKALGE